MGEHSKILLLIATLFSLLILNDIKSQEIRFEHINRENGLPINSVTTLYQDNDGFVWMGSMYGLVKYNGTNYKTFQYNYNDSTTIPGYYVTQIIGNKQGRIYMTLAESGFTTFNPKTEEFRTYITTNTPQLLSNYINNIALNNNDDAWLATSNGLYYYNYNNEQISKLEITNEYVEIDTVTNYHNYYAAVTADSLGNLYILGYKSTLLYYNIKSKTLSQIKYTEEEQESVFLFNSGHLFIDKKNKLWICTENNGVYVWDIKKQKTIARHLPGIMVTVIKQIDGNIWMGTDGKGLVIIDSEGNHIETLTNNPLDPRSLNSNTIYSVMQSTDKTIWVGFYSKGVDLYNPARYKFGNFNQLSKSEHRLTNNTVLCLKQLNDSILLIGTDGGGINYLNLLTGKIALLKSKNDKLNSIVAKSITINNNTSFYLGTYGEGLFYCEINNRFIVSAQNVTRENSDKYRHVWSLYKDSDTAIWVGYLHAGLSIYNPLNNKFRVLEDYNEHSVHYINKIDDKIWISSEQKGMSRCNSKGEMVSWFENNGNEPSSLSSNFVLEIFKDSKDRVWIGTNTTGLNELLNIDNQEFICYNNTIDFPASMVTNIEEDKNGMLWISSNMGIIKFNPDTKKYKLYDNKDGLKGRQFNIHSSFNDNYERFYFGGVEGLSYFSPEKVRSFNIKSQLAFTNLFIESVKVNVGDTVNGRVVLTKPMEYTNKLMLSYKDEDFTIEFSALHFEATERNRYKYILEGFDDEWIECKPGELSARYTNLTKGNFVFKVIAANPDGQWSKEPIEVTITIEPPFYATVWFYWLAILVLAVLVFLLIRWREHKLQQDKLKLKQLIDLKTQALREKTDKVVEQNIEIKKINNTLKEYNKTRDKIFSIIAHDLRSPLNAIVSFSKLLEMQYSRIDDTEKRKYINIIGKTSVKMNDLITNLLFWVNNQVGKIEPKPENINIDELFSDLEEFTKANALEKQHVLEFENNNATVFADREMLFTIIRNLLSNSIKFTQKKGNISVKAIMNDGITTITVSDNGVGMSSDQINVLEKRETLLSTQGTDNETGTGLGLFLCKDFTEKNKGVFQIDSKINKGTKVKLSFPSVMK